MSQQPPERIFAVKRQLPVRVGWVVGKAARPTSLAYHREIEFHFVKHGCGCYFIAGKNYPFSKNSLLIIPSNNLHNFIPQAEAHVEKGTIIFSASLLKANWRLARFQSGVPHHVKLSEEEATRIEIILRHIGEENKYQQEFCSEIIRLKVMEFLFVVKRALKRPEPAPVENPVITKLLEYIEAHYARHVKVASIAREFGYSERHLARMFKRYAGLGIKHFILQRQIAEAKRYLEDQPSLRVDAVSENVGFVDFAEFNRAFKIIAGITPSAYRRISHPHV